MKITEILKDSNYKLTQFTQEQIAKLEASIFIKEVRGKQVPYTKCLVRKKDIQLKPEEVVRQLYLVVLNEVYLYPFDRMDVEYKIQSGNTSIGRADIVVFDSKLLDQEYIIVETKKPKRYDVKKQLESYCKPTGSSIGVWTNGDNIEIYYLKESRPLKTRHFETTKLYKVS